MINTPNSSKIKLQENTILFYHWKENDFSRKVLKTTKNNINSLASAILLCLCTRSQKLGVECLALTSYEMVQNCQTTTNNVRTILFDSRMRCPSLLITWKLNSRWYINNLISECKLFNCFTSFTSQTTWWNSCKSPCERTWLV